MSEGEEVVVSEGKEVSEGEEVEVSQGEGVLLCLNRFWTSLARV